MRKAFRIAIFQAGRPPSLALVDEQLGLHHHRSNWTFKSASGATNLSFDMHPGHHCAHEDALKHSQMQGNIMNEQYLAEVAGIAHEARLQTSCMLRQGPSHGRWQRRVVP